MTQNKMSSRIIAATTVVNKSLDNAEKTPALSVFKNVISNIGDNAVNVKTPDSPNEELERLDTIEREMNENS